MPVTGYDDEPARGQPTKDLVASSVNDVKGAIGANGEDVGVLEDCSP